MQLLHHPVCRESVLEVFKPSLHGAILDTTFGAGGHAEALLATGAKYVLGVDRDPRVKSFADSLSDKYPKRFFFAEGNFSDVDRLCHAHLQPRIPICGILFDLGVSSMQIDEPERGFSFGKDGPLDMRMDPTQGESAADLLSKISEGDLIEVLKNNGDVRDAKAVARSILNFRAMVGLQNTTQLKSAIFHGLPRRPYRYAFRTTVQVFQAIRIAVNKELEALGKGLRAGWRILERGGRMVVISYHSGEDRVVKQYFASRRQLGEGRLLFDKPKTPSPSEVRGNSRSRSAKLRAVEKIR